MAKQIITDEELILKRKARRRLIGAIALTTMVVILLPMILDNEPPAPSHDIELQIPDKDKAGEFVPNMALPPSNASSAVIPTASAQLIAPLMDVKPASAAVPTRVEAKPPVEIKPVVAASSAVEVIPAPVAAAKPAAAEIKPKVETKPAVKPVAKHHSGFVVQVGAFANEAAAIKLQEKLHKQGYPSYTEKAGNKTRVRIGDYTTHAEADKVRRKLEIQGMQPDVVTLK